MDYLRTSEVELRVGIKPSCQNAHVTALEAALSYPTLQNELINHFITRCEVRPLLDTWRLRKTTKVVLLPMNCQ